MSHEVNKYSCIFKPHKLFLELYFMKHYPNVWAATDTSPDVSSLWTSYLLFLKCLPSWQAPTCMFCVHRHDQIFKFTTPQPSSSQNPHHRTTKIWVLPSTLTSVLSWHQPYDILVEITCNPVTYIFFPLLDSTLMYFKYKHFNKIILVYAIRDCIIKKPQIKQQTFTGFWDCSWWSRA